VSELRQKTREEIEALYLEPRELFVPDGVFSGRHLFWLDTEGARDPFLRPLEEILFARLTFHVDFVKKRWFWFDRRLGLGHFQASIGPSRWRDTDTIRLLYDDRLLPNWLNYGLYDEVRPMSEELCLGLGGVNGKRGRGDQFYFELTRIA
jgi:hypothetical protein